MQKKPYIQQSSINSFKNIIVIGKTGLGKSYFLNLLLLEQQPKQGIFKVYNKLDSGTTQCQIELNKLVKYGKNDSDQILLNLIDTPGLFDTYDDANKKYKDNDEPRSIKHLKNIHQAVQNKPFQFQFNRIILVLNSDQKFDTQHQQMVNISKIMIGQQMKICVIITRCQNLYDRESQEEQECFGTLQLFEREWREKLAKFGIEDIFFLSSQSILWYEQKQDTLSKFYYKQWMKLFDNIQKSVTTQINTWENLPLKDKQTIGSYFNYYIGEQDDQYNQFQNNVQQQFLQQEKKLKQEMQQKQQQLENRYQKEMKSLKQQSIKEREQFHQQIQDLKREKKQLENKVSDYNYRPSSYSTSTTYSSNNNNDYYNCNSNNYNNNQSNNSTNNNTETVTRTRRQPTSSSSGCLSFDVSINCAISDLKIDSQESSQISNTKLEIKGWKKLNTCLGFIHYSSNQVCEFLQIKYTWNQSQSFIDITQNHLIYCSNRQEFIKAIDINIHDKLLLTDNEFYYDVKIDEITKIEKKGFYSPLTSTGTFFGNKILLSCYVCPTGMPAFQKLAHFAMKPLILYRQIILKRNDETGNPIVPLKDYQSSYAELLMWIFCQRTKNSALD